MIYNTNFRYFALKFIIIRANELDFELDSLFRNK